MNTNNPTQPINPLIKIASGLVGAVLLSLAVVPAALAEQQEAADLTSQQPGYYYHSGQPRGVEFVVALEAQAGGDELAKASRQECSVTEVNGEDVESCITYSESLDAGDSIGIGVGALVPLGRSNVDLEFLLGTARGAVQDPSIIGDSDNAASSRFTTLRALALVQMKNNSRLGGGLVAHTNAGYKVKGSSSREFDTAVGLRFQMEWHVAPEMSTGFYLQSIRYEESEDNGNDEVDADALGYVLSFHFR